MTQVDNIDSLIPFTDSEAIIPGDVNINPNIFGSLIEEDASTGTQMFLSKPNGTRQLKFISSESLLPETIRLSGGGSLELSTNGFAFLLYLKLGNDGRPINKWKIIGGHKFDIFI